MGQHGFATTGGTHEEDVVAAGGSDLQGALGQGLAPDLLQGSLGGNAAWYRRYRRRPRPQHRRSRSSLLRAAFHNKFHHIAQGIKRIRFDTRTPQRLGQISSWHDNPTIALPIRQIHHRQNTPHPFDSSVQRQLSNHQKVPQTVRFQNPRFGQQPQGNGQIIRRPLLAQISRGHVHQMPTAR